MKNIFSVKTPGGQWWHGEFSVRYDLFTAAKLLLGLVIVPFLLLFYVGKGLYLGAVWLFKRLKPLGVRRLLSERLPCGSDFAGCVNANRRLNLLPRLPKRRRRNGKRRSKAGAIDGCGGFCCCRCWLR